MVSENIILSFRGITPSPKRSKTFTIILHFVLIIKLNNKLNE